MPFNINELRGALIGGGSRPTLFEVHVTNKYASVAADLKLQFTCEAASLPGSSIGSYEVSYFGRKIKYAGDRTYADWSVTVINDEDFLVRNGFEAWVNAMNDTELNIQLPSAALSQYKQSQAQVIQYGKNGEPIHIIEFDNIWPSTIGDITTSWAQQNSISTFGVTFKYDYFRRVL